MKLIRFGEKGNEKPGVLLEGRRRDCSSEFEDWNHSFFQHNGIEKLKKFVRENGKQLPVVQEDVRWASCIARPGMIFCAGLNYSDHAKEAGMELPQEPLIFGKAPNTIGGPYDDVIIPKQSVKTDYEVELGVVLSKNANYLKSEEEAASYIAGFCVANDLSERSFQLERGGQWIKGKSSVGFCPVGPYLCTSDEVDNPLALSMQLTVNGELRQSGNTRTMVFKPDYLIYYLSQFMMLEAGDLILTGTPPGVGLGMDPPTYLNENDIVELSIEGLGRQKQRFVSYKEPGVVHPSFKEHILNEG
jgi:2,4-didehydro-3-deoxy-L-rhamnonate hydrolase